MGDISISAKTYCKIILHAAKYPHCSVNGVLLAKASSTKGSKLEYVDAVPLFHVVLNLTPMAEIALTQIDQVAMQAGLVVAGYYTAHENLKDISFEKANNRIAEKIAENFSNACLIVVDNKNLSLRLETMALRMAQYTDGKYRPIDVNKVQLSPDHTLEACSSLLEKHAYKCLVDFDNHLDNICEDWMNDELNKEIESVL